MPDEIGEDTRDLRDLGITHPTEQRLAERERDTRVRRYGRRRLTAGITLIGTGLFGSLALAISTEGPTLVNPVAKMFGVLALIAVINAGAALIVVGSVERLQRPQRAMLRQVLADNHASREQREIQDDACRERQELIIGLVSAIPGRLSVIEEQLEKVKRFEDGVELGAELRRAVLGHDKT